MDGKKLQQMINRTVAAQNAYYHAQLELTEWCRETYGYEPGDVDADDIIDGVLGGSGTACGMKAADFDKSMRSYAGRS